MIINPRDVINNGWVTGIHDIEKQVQPNAIDFTLDRIFEINNDPFYIYDENGEEQKRKRRQQEKELFHDIDTQKTYFVLEADRVYDGMSNMYVNVPNDVAAVMFVRSTFNRNGIFIVSGLYDTGFSGNIGFVVHNRVKANAFIAPGTSIGQIMFMYADASHTYKGGYNTDQGEHWTEKQVMSGD